MKNQNNSLQFNFSEAQTSISESWVRLVQVGIAPATATIGDTADFVNSIFQINSCNTNADAGKPVTQDKFVTIVKDSFNLDLCNTLPDGNTIVQLKVILSDPALPYILRLTNGGIVTSTTIVSETISTRIVVKDANSVQLPFPVTGISFFSWAGTVWSSTSSLANPVIRASSSALYFDTQLTGIVAAEYQTKYYLVNLKIPSDKNCSAICFYQKQVVSLDLQRPESQGTLSDWEKYCNPSIVGIIPKPDVTCYKMIEQSWRCECDTQRESRSANIRQNVDCPEGFAGYVEKPGSYQIGTEHVIAGYEHCPDDYNQFFDLHDPDFYKEKCCHAVPKDISLPYCRIKTSKNPGGVPIENGADYYIGLYGPNTKIVPVSPADGDCGDMETIQDVYQHNCCDGITPIYWDYDNSAEIISDNSKGLVKVTGGRPPYVWQIRGSGFWGNAACTYRDVETEAPYLWIYTTDACGSCDVYVTDGCSKYKGFVKSDQGQWVPISSIPTNCVDLGNGTYWYDPYSNLYFYEVIKERYKQNSTLSNTWYQSSLQPLPHDLQIILTYACDQTFSSDEAGQICNDWAQNTACPSTPTFCAEHGMPDEYCPGDVFPQCGGWSSQYIQGDCGNGTLTSIRCESMHHCIQANTYYEWQC